MIISIYCGSLKSWGAFAKINDKKVEKILEWRNCTDFMAVSGNTIFVENRDGKDDIGSKFSLKNIENYNTEGIAYEFFNESNERLHCVHAQKDNLYFWKNDNLYKFNINQV